MNKIYLRNVLIFLMKALLLFLITVSSSETSFTNDTVASSDLSVYQAKVREFKPLLKVHC